MVSTLRDFHEDAIKTVLKYHGGIIANAKVRPDGHEDCGFKQYRTSHLRRDIVIRNKLDRFI